jgi:outer membrane protein insertion porin family
LSTEYSEQRTGVALWLEKALNDFIRGRIEYGIQDIDLNVDQIASQELQSQSGSHTRSSVTGTLVYDTRDSVFLTTRGNRTEVSAELAGGPMGGNVDDYKLNAKTSFYFPFFDKQVLQLVGAAGVVDAFGSSRNAGSNVTETVFGGGVTNTVHASINPVPIFDRYFLGGANTLRGFAFRQVSPKDGFGEPIGGNGFMNATAEYTYPIVERVRGAFFFDIGNVYQNAYDFSLNNMKSDAGIGVRLNLPIGPLRLDYGYPIMTDQSSGRTGKIQFSVGYQF